MIPTITVSAVPSAIAEGQSGAFRISASAANPAGPITVFYTLSGKARIGTDYTVNGLMGQVVLPTGQTSVDIVVTAMGDATKEHSEKISITLSPGSGYTLAKGKGHKKAKMTIQNVGGTSG